MYGNGKTAKKSNGGDNMETKAGQTAGGLLAMVGGIDALFIGGLASGVGMAAGEILIWLGLASILIGGARALLPANETAEEPHPSAASE